MGGEAVQPKANICRFVIFMEVDLKKNYSEEVAPLTKGEKAWIKKLENVLLSCPSARIALQTIGDSDMQVVDASIVDKYDLETCDGGADEHGVTLGGVQSKPQIWGVSG